MNTCWSEHNSPELFKILQSQGFTSCSHFKLVCMNLKKLLGSTNPWLVSEILVTMVSSVKAKPNWSVYIRKHQFWLSATFSSNHYDTRQVHPFTKVPTQIKWNVLQQFITIRNRSIHLRTYPHRLNETFSSNYYDTKEVHPLTQVPTQTKCNAKTDSITISNDFFKSL